MSSVASSTSVDARRPQAPMEWTERHDVILTREILVSEPFRYKKGSVDKGKAWSAIADTLNSSMDLQFKVSQRSVRERFALIQEKYKKKISQDERSSGTSMEVTELDVLIEEITEKEKAAEEMKGSNENRGKMDADRAKAEEARKRAMERVGQTRRRLSEDGEECGKKRRRSGNDTIAFLRERSQMDRELREKELELKKKEMEEQARRAQQSQQQMAEMMQMMQQQQAQMQATQATLLQQQQQQGQALLALIGKLIKEN